MKKVLLVIIYLFFQFQLSIGHSAEEYKMDGYRWESWNFVKKLGFVEGWLTGYESIHLWLPQILIGVARREEKIIGSKKYPDIDFLFNTADGLLRERGFDLYDVTFGQIIDMIDKLYSDPRVKTWPVNKIMPLVRGRLKGGWTEKDLDEVIAFWIKGTELSGRSDSSMSKPEREKLNKQVDELLLEEPKVLKALRAYRLEF